jgi:hypothetical protein
MKTYIGGLVSSLIVTANDLYIFIKGHYEKKNKKNMYMIQYIHYKYTYTVSNNTYNNNNNNISRDIYLFIYCKLFYPTQLR